MMKKRSVSLAWMLVAYSLAIPAANLGNHGAWRNVTIGLAAAVLHVVVILIVRAKLHGGCGRNGPGPGYAPPA